MTSHPNQTLAERLGDTVAPLLVDADERGVAVGACPALESILDTMSLVDRSIAQVIRLLIAVQETGEVEEMTGVALEQWLSQTGRATNADRRMLQTAATVLARMPRTMDAFEQGKLSWSQVRVIVLETRRVPKGLWATIDDQICEDIDLWLRAGPDDLGRRLAIEIAGLVPDQEERDADKAERGRFLSIQPSLMDEYHGRLYGEGPNAALALIANGLDALIPPPDSSARDRVGADADAAHESIMTQGRRRFDALVWMFATHPGTNGTTGDEAAVALPDDWDGPTDLITAAGTPLHLTLTCDLATLLELADLPGHVATSLTGGRLRVSAATARRLANAGATLRLLVTDDTTGNVIGIGRRSRVAPDWLREAVTTMFPTSIAPGSRASSRHCDLDHHHEWADGGHTSLDNLAPVNRGFHTAKSRGDWSISTNDDGSRQVTHTRSGWTQTIIPATRRIHLTPKTTSDPPR